MDLENFVFVARLQIGNLCLACAAQNTPVPLTKLCLHHFSKFGRVRESKRE